MGRSRNRIALARKGCTTGFIAVVIAAGALATGCSAEDAVAITRPLPQVMVFAIGNHNLTLVNASTRRIEKSLRISASSDQEFMTGSDLIAFARTGRGLFAYVMTNSHTVVPVDVATGRAAKPIKVGGLFSAAIGASHDGKAVYVLGSNGNGKPGIVTPIDITTDTAEHPIPVGVQPDAIAFSPNGKLAYVANEDDNTITPIKVATNTSMRPIHARQSPNVVHVIVFTPNGRIAYVAGPQITPINVADGKARVPIAAASNDLAITPDGKTLYAETLKKVTPINTATDHPRRSIPIGGYRLLMAPNGKHVYVLNPDYMSSHASASLTPIDTKNNTAGTTTPVGEAFTPDAAITPNGKAIYITTGESNVIYLFDTATRKMSRPIKARGIYKQVVMSP